ncbi:THAP-type domain-containing protein [Trichonephila clavata]|uniref:THAP-type domain-containing protein n=1 Tax=Trichonephila clavata TaxID=2740835 RepID=A0A8X6FC27_TRICU|nr:THAP-type domain-containing protein [Trichonephila clavata]
MVACCVPCCLSTKRENKDRSFHLFPADPLKRKEWERSIFGEDFNMELRIAYVCSKHFKSTDFTRMNFFNQKRKILKREAVPSVCITNMKRKEPSETGPPFRRLKLLNIETDVKKQPEVYTDTHEEKSGKVYSNAKSYGLKITHLKKMVNSRTKKVELLEKTVSELNKKLDYYEKNVVFQNMKKIMMLEEQGEGNTTTSFILTQVKNFNKKKPLWPETVIRESVILHEISQEAYNTLIKRKILQLPTRMTLSRYLKSGLFIEENQKLTSPKPEPPKKQPKSNQNNQKSLCYLVVDTATGNQHYIYGRPLPENDSEQNNDEEKKEADNQEELYEEQDNKVVDDEEVNENEDVNNEFEEDIVNESEGEIINMNDYKILNETEDEIIDEDEDENLIEYENMNKNKDIVNVYGDGNEYEENFLVDYAEENENNNYEFEEDVNDYVDENLKDHDAENSMYRYEGNCKINCDEGNGNDFEEENASYEEESVQDYEEANINDFEEENGDNTENQALNHEKVVTVNKTKQQNLNIIKIRKME